jgi:hypothetical protein
MGMNISDAEYFHGLQERESDPLLKRFFEIWPRLFGAKAHASMLAAGYKITEEEFKRFSDPLNIFEGDYIRSLRGQAIRILGKKVANFGDTRAFLLSAQNLNGFAALTPNGTPFIVLNHGIIFILGYYTAWFMAFYTWFTPKPYCRDHSQAEFAQGILRLAHFEVAGDLNSIAEAETLYCPSIPKFQPDNRGFEKIIELAIILHEFGHLILGHVNGSPTYRIRVSRDTELEALKLSRQQEFEADAFAFRCICDSGLAPDYVAFSMGLLFKFFELCHRLSPPTIPESKWTHPHPEARWKNIKDLAGATKSPKTLMADLDHSFDVLFRGSGFKT